MNKTLIIALLLSPMATLFQGCQRETSAPPAPAMPAAAASSAASPAPSVSPGAAMKPEAAVAVAAPGNDMRALAQKSGCFACHAVDKKMVGPAWNDVAVKYRGQKDAETKLVAKVAKGGSGVWGAMPMPPNEPRVKEEDIRALVRFILSLK